MGARYRNWRVRGFQREHHEDGFVVGSEVVVVITEPGRWEWELVLSGDDITDFRIHGQRSIDMKALTHVPLADLGRMASAYLARVQSQMDDGLHVWESLLLSEMEPGEARMSDDSPSPKDFSRAWHSIDRVTADGTPRREALAQRFGVTPYAIDKWSRKAREQGLIPPATTGRPRRGRTTTEQEARHVAGDD